MNRAALTSLMRGADPLEVLASLRNRPEPRRGEPAPELPNDPADFVGRYIYWPHIEEMDPETGGPRAVCSLNPMQLDFLKHRSSFRIDGGGQPIPGSDCVMKSRRIRMTSVCFGLQIWAALRMPQTRHMAVFQLAKRSVIDEAINQVLFALRRLPAWLGLEPGEDAGCLRVANRILFRNGSRYEFMSAGHNRRCASQLGRGARLDSLLLSESRSYAEPEEVWQAAGKAVTKGWIISESTPPTSRENWHAQSWLLTRDGQGEFRKAHFWPWYHDPLKRLTQGSPTFEAMHRAGFVEALPPGTLEEETALGLDDEQRAFRRQERFCGTPMSRRLARAENPESVTDAFSTTDLWLDRGAIELCARQCCDPLYKERLGSLHTVLCWLAPGDMRGEQLVVFVDTAAKHGKDFSCVRARTASTLRVVAEVHGRALASELCAAIVWLINRYVPGGVSNTLGYCVGVERNAGSGKDLLELLQRAGLKVGRRAGLYAETVEDRRPGRKGRKRVRPGFQTSAAARSAMLDRIAASVEGIGWDAETGEAAPVGPTVEFRSKGLVDELAQLGEIEGKIAATTGHDDRVIAEGGLLILAERVARRTPASLAGGGSRRAGQHKRTVKKRLLPKRSRPG